MDYAKAYDVIMKTVMPQSHPIGVKILRAADEPPEKAVRPGKFGLKVAMCQWPALARRWGWITAVTSEEVNCVPCITGFGFKRLKDPADLAQFFMDMGYSEDPEVVARLAGQIEPLPVGEVKGIAAFPLNKAPVDPDLVMVYGTPAQMTRMAIGYVRTYGDRINTMVGVGLSCLTAVTPHWKDQPLFVNPGRGERMLAGTDDAEMFLSLPVKYLEGLVAGLEGSHKKGMRFPLQGFVLYEPAVIPPMKALEKKLQEP